MEIFKLFLLIITSLSISSCYHFHTEHKLKVSIYYEVSSKESQHFISNELERTSNLLSEDLIVDFVPFGFGKAFEQDGKFHFVCEHGHAECGANRIHACAISLGTNNTGNNFIFCSMKSSNPSSDTNLKQCAESSGISWQSIEECVKSEKGNKLMIMNGHRTQSLKPKMTSLPTVVIQCKYEPSIQHEIQNNFLEVLCFYLGNEHKSCSREYDSKLQMVK